MKHRMYSWRDKLAEMSNPIFFQKNDALAVRAVNKHIKDADLDPAEYALLYLGTFDEETNEFDLCIPVKEVMY